MKLISFTEDIYKKLPGYGYTHIEIKDPITDEALGDGAHRQVQIFKALDRIDTMPATANIVALTAPIIKEYLANDKLNCYIVVQAKDVF